MVAQECLLLASSSQLASARAYVSEAATAFGFDTTSTYELVYAVNEAITNAIRHGAPDANGMIQLSVSDEGDVLSVTVHDSGTFEMPTPGGPAPGAEHGRGFALMASFADSVQVCIGAGGTTVSLSKGRT
jgi:anti-sigma regulatory factor (Ser/Thr protein kinase)